ncbi:beta-glycosyltransferase [Parapedobacter pyrenivorans]|uniref:Beta-glycosyltransferase n=1 Tax=Parapedobacter pyrenivorans TaxID=1305674 RepID=A0A917HNW3_9SPHI|nr:glycosyltransferase family 2 protein [Parapedobacter pyrenivorans]GGG84843.1 beta-glycosyltransferase [Parapedobacter pyrenivorans]
METTVITIFTPTYNRGSHLAKLYESIKQQRYHGFEWIIVDDGSEDGTGKLVEGFQAEGKVEIQYFFQQNAGKHIAINRGVKAAKGELFFIVDSDDLLMADSLQIINEAWRELYAANKAKGFAGICGLRCFQNGKVIGGEVAYQTLDVSMLDYRYRYGYKGDKAEVFITNILSRYPFPALTGETFCTEGLVWNRIGRSYKMRFINKGLYVTEYLNDGLSAKSFQLRKKSPTYAMLFYSELLNTPGISLRYKLRAALNFWRFAIYDRRHSLIEKQRQIRQLWALCFLPASYFLYCLESLKK